MTTRYPRCLPAKIIKFFSENPDEELTYANLSKKFNAKFPAISHAVKELVADGIIEDCPRVIRKRKTPFLGDLE
jgi:DNA-binding Lrp family transcriptional regulator